MYPKFQKLSKCTIGLISTILIIIALYCFFNNWMYYFFDIGVKAISGIGAILAIRYNIFRKLNKDMNLVVC